ncbi:MAG TPA: hypothetical protein DCY10_04980 [Clostridiales bacterium]|jgi:hypothetical protein|nr:hypothetical protein [Clostridiales bacterium]
MKKKSLRAILVTLALLLIAFAVVLTSGSLASEAVVASTPAYEAQSVDAQAERETIADPEVPLAAPQTIETVQLTIIPVQEDSFTDEAPIVKPPIVKEPVEEEPASEEPASGEPASEETVVISSAAIRLLERAYALLAQYNAATTTAEKRAILEAPNNSLGNDAFRSKLLADLGGNWEQLEADVVAVTEYQQGKTLYVQVYMSGISSNYVPVVYTTQNADRSGNQWATNLVYNDETATWMEYTQKHAYNESRVGFYMTTLYNNEDGWEELKETMESSDVWQPVEASTSTED